MTSSPDSNKNRHRKKRHDTPDNRNSSGEKSHHLLSPREDQAARRYTNIFEDPLLHQAFRVLDSMQDRGIDVEKLLSASDSASKSHRSAAQLDQTRIMRFILNKHVQGVVTEKELGAIVSLAQSDRDNAPSSQAITNQQMMAKILELHPELAEEVRNLMPSLTR